MTEFDLQYAARKVRETLPFCSPNQAMIAARVAYEAGTERSRSSTSSARTYAREPARLAEGCEPVDPAGYAAAQLAQVVLAAVQEDDGVFFYAVQALNAGRAVRDALDRGEVYGYGRLPAAAFAEASPGERARRERAPKLGRRRGDVQPGTRT